MQKFTHKMGGRAQPPLWSPVYINKDTLAQFIYIPTHIPRWRHQFKIGSVEEKAYTQDWHTNIFTTSSQRLRAREKVECTAEKERLCTFSSLYILQQRSFLLLLYSGFMRTMYHIIFVQNLIQKRMYRSTANKCCECRAWMTYYTLACRVYTRSYLRL